jgi:hypothetical protein
VTQHANTQHHLSGFNLRRQKVVKCCGKISCSNFVPRVKNGSKISVATKSIVGIKMPETQMQMSTRTENPVTTLMEAEETVEITSQDYVTPEVG